MMPKQASINKKKIEIADKIGNLTKIQHKKCHKAKSPSYTEQQNDLIMKGKSNKVLNKPLLKNKLSM